MGSIEGSAFRQLEDITKYGKYIIHVGDGIPKDIRSLVKVQILKRHSTQSEYTLDELKDLQSKLALIKGKMLEDDIKDMAEKFWQVSILICMHTCVHQMKKHPTPALTIKTSFL